MRVLVSAASVAEAVALADLGVDIVDVKNPVEGSLGAQPPGQIRDITRALRGRGVAVSAALGDLPAQPGTAALAAFAAASLGVDFIKAGLHGATQYAQALGVMRAVTESVRMQSEGTRVVAAGYADYRRFGGLSPAELVAAARDAACHTVMLDTAFKDGGSLLDAMTRAELERFVAAARDAELEVALAGSLRAEHLPIIRALAPDLIGVRSAVCAGSKRHAAIDSARVQSFLDAVREAVPAPSPAERFRAV